MKSPVTKLSCSRSDMEKLERVDFKLYYDYRQCP